MNICEENELAILPFVSGVSHLLVVGAGEVQLQKSVDGKKTFYPLTDGSGELVEFSSEDADGVLFNSEIENDCQRVHYAIKCLSGEVKYTVAK